MLKIPALQVVFLFLVILACRGFASDPYGNWEGIIKVSPDNFTFQDAIGRRFLPMGAYYFNDRHGETDPLDWWGAVREDELRSDFAKARELNCNTLRMRWTLTAVDAKATPPVIGSATDWQKCDLIVRLAREAGLRLYVGLTIPGYFRQDNRYLPLYEEGFRRVSERYAEEPTIFCWEVDAEATTLVGYPGDREIWEDWLNREYGDMQAVAAAWGKTATGEQWLDDVWSYWTKAVHHSSAYDEIRNATPELWYLDELNRTGLPEYRDWQRFRDALYVKKIRRLTDAIRSADRKHLITADLIVWTFPFYRNPGAAGWGGPYGYAANGLSDLAYHVDFFGVHTYPMYIPPHTQEWYEELFKDETIFERQLRYLETLVRFVRTNTGKPVVLSETGWHGGAGDYYGNTEADQSRWCEALIDRTRNCAVGWINWAFADSPAHPDITRTSGLVTTGIQTVTSEDKELAPTGVRYAGALPAEKAHRTKAWGKRFSELVVELHEDPKLRFEPGTSIQAELSDLTTMKCREQDKILQEMMSDVFYPGDIQLRSHAH